MTIKMADKLVELRKKMGLSQEELAEKIGVSRQAVSKWERAEAAPDTDNLIALAKLYGISVDELLGLECADKKQRTTKGDQSKRRIKVDLPFVHINVRNDDDADDECHEYDWFKESSEKFYKDGADTAKEDDRGYTCVVNDEEVVIGMKKKSLWLEFPYPVLAAIAFLIMGFVYQLWHPGWMVFLTIPLYYWLVNAISKRKIPTMSASAIITIAYLVIGFGWGMWHPWWIMFLAIPIFEFFGRMLKCKKDKSSDNETVIYVESDDTDTSAE